MAPGKPGDLLTASNVDKDIRSHAADSRRVSNGDSGFILTSAVLVQVRITPKIASKEFGQEVFELYFQHRQGDRQPISPIRPHSTTSQAIEDSSQNFLEPGVTLGDRVG